MHRFSKQIDGPSAQESNLATKRAEREKREAIAEAQLLGQTRSTQ